MLTSEYIKEKAKEYGASVCGVGSLDIFEGEIPERNPKLILPNAKTIIGFGFAVPKGLYETLGRQTQVYNYTQIGVSCIDTEFSEVFLFKMGRIIEDEGYDACLQRAIPNLRIKGDKTTNPEVFDTYELIHASPVEEGKPAPEVMIDYNKAAIACGLGKAGLSGRILSPKYGPYIRYTFIITDAPLEADKPLTADVCDGCEECVKACPGKAITRSGVNTWQCAVYYKGAHKSNRFMKDETLEGEEDKEKILEGEKTFESGEEARKIFPKLRFLPHTASGYEPCLCYKACDRACYKHLKEKGII